MAETVSLLVEIRLMVPQYHKYWQFESQGPTLTSPMQNPLCVCVCVCVYVCVTYGSRLYAKGLVVQLHCMSSSAPCMLLERVFGIEHPQGQYISKSA